MSDKGTPTRKPRTSISGVSKSGHTLIALSRAKTLIKAATPLQAISADAVLAVTKATVCWHASHKDMAVMPFAY